MRLLRICLVLLIAPGAWAQQSRPANAPAKQDAPLTRGSFSASGLGIEGIVNDFFTGNFADIPSRFDREKVLFEGLFRQYQEAYGRHCDANLPANKVELKTSVCVSERYSVNRYGERVGGSDCLEYRDVGIGIYTDPALESAITKLGKEEQGSLVKDAILKMGDQNTVNEMAQLPGDMDALMGLNSCTSPGLKRFQENLVLFSMGKQPILLSGAAPAVTSQGPFKDQNYSRLLDDLINEQAKTWILNRFVRGSTFDVVVSSRDAAGRPSRIVGKYLFSGGKLGSVTVDFSDGTPHCMYFFDSPSSCNTPDRRIVAAYSSGAYPQSEAGAVQPGGVSAANPARVPPPAPPVQPASSSAPPAQARPAPPHVAAPAPPPVATPAPAPALTAEQLRQQQAAEIQKRAAKFTACRDQEAQSLKDRPGDTANVVKEYAACIQAK